MYIEQSYSTGRLSLNSLPAHIAYRAQCESVKVRWLKQS